MKTPFIMPHSPRQRRLLTITLLTLAMAVGCQTPSFMTAKSDPKPSPAMTVSSEQAGLPKPTNTGTSNSPLSLSSVDEHLRLGEQALEQGDYQQSQMHFDHVLQKHPDHVKAHHRLGVLADKLGQFAQAEQHYLSALNGDPRNMALLSDLGYSYFMQGRYADSERYLLEARNLNPNYDKAIANLGLLYASTGRQQESLAMFRQIGDDAQVQSMMQQIASGQFNPTQQLASNSFVGQQNSVVTTQTSVQQATPIPPQEMNNATRDFLQQMRTAREDLHRAEEQYAMQQQTTQPQQFAQQQSPNRQPAPQHAGVTPFASQQSLPQRQLQPPMQPGYVPDNALAGMIAAVDRQPQANPSRAPIVIGRPGTTNDPSQWSQQSAATPQAGAMTASGNPQTVPIYTGSTGRQNPPHTQFSQQTQPPTPTQTQPSPTALSQWSQNGQPGNSTPYGATPAQQSFSQTVDQNRSANPPSAWAQQFAGSAGQSRPMSGMPGQGPIQQTAANTNPYEQRPVEHAHHTQQPGQQPDIALAGQQSAANSSLVPPSLNGNWAQQQPANMAGTTLPPQSQATAGSYEQARREAALLGLGAGPGQVFPYIQQTQRVMPGTDSRINGAQYPAPVRHMPSGLTPPNLNPAFAGPQTTNLTPSNTYHGQPLPNIPVPVNGPANYAAPSSASFPQHQQMNYQSTTPVPASDPYQDTRVQQSARLNGLINQTWGQSPQSPPYGVTPPSTTQQYGSATSFTPPPSAQTPAPYNQRAAVSAPQATTRPAGSLVIPEPYRPASQTNYNGPQPSIQGQPYGRSNSGTPSYAVPTIIPGRR